MGYQLDMGWLSAIHQLAMSYPASYELAIVWLLAGHEMAKGLLSIGYQLDRSWLWAIYQLAMSYHRLAMGWLWTGY